MCWVSRLFLLLSHEKMRKVCMGDLTTVGLFENWSHQLSLPLCPILIARIWGRILARTDITRQPHPKDCRSRVAHRTMLETSACVPADGQNTAESSNQGQHRAPFGKSRVPGRACFVVVVVLSGSSAAWTISLCGNWLGAASAVSCASYAAGLERASY